MKHMILSLFVACGFFSFVHAAEVDNHNLGGMRAYVGQEVFDQFKQELAIARQVDQRMREVSADGTFRSADFLYFLDKVRTNQLDVADITAASFQAQEYDD